MPCWIRRLTPEGLQEVAYQADSLDEAAQHEPRDGVYTVTNTYQRYKVLKWDAHLDRLEDSAQRAGIPLQLDRARLNAALRQLIDEADVGAVRFRVTVPAAQPKHRILSLEPFTPPSPELIAQGVRVITAQTARHNPEAKTNDWMHQRRALKEAQPPGIYDTFLVDDEGYLLEGLASNVYTIREGVLYTAGSGVLKGISRQIVLAVAPPIVPVREEAAHQDEMPHLDECFLTSSSRGIIPVVEINGIMIGSGVPGPLTRQLRAAYDAWVNDHLTTL